MNKDYEEEYTESEKCETPCCNNLKEVKFTFEKDDIEQTEEICYECLDYLLNDNTRKYFSIDEIEKPKIHTMKRGN